MKFLYLQGVNLVKELISDYGLNVVQAYMNHIQVHYYVAFVRESVMTHETTAGKR
jgi:N-methylhydantoinase B/oxoprolinase/acetone carboxylase alpha subunit